MAKEIIKVETLEQLKELYENSAMTWEGLIEEGFMLALDEVGTEDANGYVIEGRVMNELCGLTGNNAYNDDMHIFSVHPSKGLAIFYGARWIDDIIDNNAHREGYHPFGFHGTLFDDFDDDDEEWEDEE